LPHDVVQQAGPCHTAAFKHEFGTWKWFGVAFVYQTVLAWSMAFLIYRGGTLLGLGG
jgi:ferrous iron transport protein B